MNCRDFKSKSIRKEELIGLMDGRGLWHSASSFFALSPTTHLDSGMAPN